MMHSIMLLGGSSDSSDALAAAMTGLGLEVSRPGYALGNNFNDLSATMAATARVGAVVMFGSAADAQSWMVVGAAAAGGAKVCILGLIDVNAIDHPSVAWFPSVSPSQTAIAIARAVGLDSAAILQRMLGGKNPDDILEALMNRGAA
jgi:hypothetical protein